MNSCRMSEEFSGSSHGSISPILPSAQPWVCTVTLESRLERRSSRNRSTPSVHIHLTMSERGNSIRFLRRLGAVGPVFILRVSMDHVWAVFAFPGTLRDSPPPQTRPLPGAGTSWVARGRAGGHL